MQMPSGPISSWREPACDADRQPTMGPSGMVTEIPAIRNSTAPMPENAIEQEFQVRMREPSIAGLPAGRYRDSRLSESEHGIHSRKTFAAGNCIACRTAASRRQ